MSNLQTDSRARIYEEYASNFQDAPGTLMRTPRGAGGGHIAITCVGGFPKIKRLKSLILPAAAASCSIFSSEWDI